MRLVDGVRRGDGDGLRTARDRPAGACACVPQDGQRRVLVELVVEIATPVPDAQPPREVFDLLLGGAGEVAGQGRQRGHRDPVGVVHAAAGFRHGTGFELLEHGHQAGELRAPGADVPAVFGHRFAVVLLVRVHGHVAQPVDQHVQQPDVETPARAHLDQHEVTDTGGGQHRAEVTYVARLFRDRTLADVLVVHLPGDQ